MKLSAAVLAGTAACGILAGFAIATLTAPSSKASNHGTIAGEVNASEGAESRAESGSEAAFLDAENRALRAQLKALLQAPERGERTLAGQVNTNGEEPAALDDSSKDLLGAVVAEYRSKAFSDALEARAMHDTAVAVARSLFNEYINAQRPQDAERILNLMGKLSPDFAPTAWELTNLARKYTEQGDRGRAAALYARALGMEPNNVEFASQLAELDPAVGIALLLEANADGELLAHPTGRYNMALLLIKTGDMEGAIAALHASDGSIDSMGWELFFEHAPERALAELAEAAKTDPYGTLSLRLARYFGDNEKPEEAIRALEALLATNPSNVEAIDCLAELSPERGLALLASSLQASPTSPDVWQRYAEQLRRLGRMDEAVQAGLEAFRLGTETWPADYLLEAAPDEVLRQFETRVTGSLDDELWGDYGDTLWRAGHAEQALKAWERARGIDGDDSEWIGKVKAMQAGKNPFGDDSDESLQELGYTDSVIFD